MYFIYKYIKKNKRKCNKKLNKEKKKTSKIAKFMINIIKLLKYDYYHIF